MVAYGDGPLGSFNCVIVAVIASDTRAIVLFTDTQTVGSYIII